MIVVDALPNLRHAVSRPANLQEHLVSDRGWRGGNEELRVFVVLGCASGKVRLMLFALRVREVGAFVGVQRETETAFKGAKMIAQDIRILIPRQMAV